MSGLFWQKINFAGNFGVATLKMLLQNCASSWITGACTIFLPFTFHFYLSKMDITVQELKQRLDAGNSDFVLIDVREPHEREEFNVGGELIPIGGFMAAVPEMEYEKDQEIVVYCRSGNRSGMAKHLLEASGYSNVKNLLGGMLAWRENFG